MPLATSLAIGNDADPRIAETAIRDALAKSDLTHPTGVLLFLTPEFAPHCRSIVTAAARRAQCLQVAGGIASGVFSESGGPIDRPAAVAMVFGGHLALGYPDDLDTPILSYAGRTMPPVWGVSGRRFGGVFGSTFAVRASDADAIVWEQGRAAAGTACSVQIHGARIDIAVSRGWHLLSRALPVTCVNGYRLDTVARIPAQVQLTAALPPGIRVEPERYLHQLVALVSSNAGDTAMAHARAIAIISINFDGSLTLAGRVAEGERLAWALRHPQTTAADMRRTVEALAEKQGTAPRPPCGALIFSCIGRSPFFYGGEDCDLRAFTERFPGVPLIGMYGTGQIAPSNIASGNTEFHNAVVTALITPFEETDRV